MKPRRKPRWRNRQIAEDRVGAIAIKIKIVVNAMNEGASFWFGFGSFLEIPFPLTNQHVGPYLIRFTPVTLLTRKGQSPPICSGFCALLAL